jgi:uncharacterized membrane protein (UPF0127 family)
MDEFFLIMNITREIALARHARIADDPLSRFIGLLGRKTLPQGEALILRPCTGIHMLGMRFPIDALYVDENDKIICAVSDLSPWHIGPFEPEALYVIELPSGTIISTGTQPGDNIACLPCPQIATSVVN